MIGSSLRLSQTDRHRIAALLMQSQNNIPESSSGSSSEEEGEKPFVPFQLRDGWDDVTPEPQDDGPDPVAVIDYTERFRNTFDYFRAILKLNEHSERAFDLTTECCELNPANYTVWYFRRVLLKALSKDLAAELRYISDVIRKHSKNYQVWHHRKLVVEGLGDASEEKKFTAEILNRDDKNYHCWQHRQWVISTFKLWDDELDFTADLISEDIRNNSAWNQRYFVVNNTTGFTEEVIDKELVFTIHRIQQCPNNESPFNYLRGILAKVGLNYSPLVIESCEGLIQNPGPKVSPHAAAFLIDADEELVELGGDQMHRDRLHRALALCDKLATEWDSIRVNYWNYRLQNLQAKSGVDIKENESDK